MKVFFGLDWLISGKNWRKGFKSQGALSLFEDYLSRIGHFSSAEAGPLPQSQPKTPGRKIWICDTSPKARQFSSEALSAKVASLQDSGVKELHIYIGGPNGFPPERVEALNPELRWSFGLMTLPHELAAAVSAEQLYRAWTILHHLPYHSGH